ncbi:hypothetical protein KSS87_017807 [Heliosperma pusillum]|nr:hypothetical protein KSS87_017807 [Heliosperma pusillum]
MAQMTRCVQMVDTEYLRQIEEARTDLHNLLSLNKQFAPTILRLAFHDAGTYDAKTNTGGTNGSVRNEMSTAPNVGMQAALDFCEQVKVRHSKVTYADLYQLAGVVAVEVTGGPKIHFAPGRKDAPPQQDKGNLPKPNGDSKHLRDIFHRMGLSDKDIVVLSGAHTLGRAHQDRSGFDGPFTRDPLTFDNSYYVLLMKGDTAGLVKFPTDNSLMQDPTFRVYVQIYARDQNLFFKDYAESHKKMSELGFHPHKHASHPDPHPHPTSHSHEVPHHNQNHSHNHNHNQNHHAQPQQLPQCRPRPPCGYF